MKVCLLVCLIHPKRLNHRNNCFSFSIKVIECLSVCSIIQPKRPNHKKIVLIFVSKEQKVCLSVSLFNNFSGMIEPIEHIIFGKIEKNHFNMRNKVICMFVQPFVSNFLQIELELMMKDISFVFFYFKNFKSQKFT